MFLTYLFLLGIVALYLLPIAEKVAHHYVLAVSCLVVALLLLWFTFNWQPWEVAIN